MCHDPERAVTRRALLATGAAVAAGALAPAPLLAALDASSSSMRGGRGAPAPSTPDKALRALVDGNARFVAGRAAAPNRDPARLRALADTQRPFAAFLGCADSRVPIEIVFDQGFGDVFPVRVAGNIVTSEVTGSLEYACVELGAKVLMVLGHAGCGAVKATIGGAPVPGLIGSLYQHIAPAVDRAGNDLAAAVRENVRIQAGLLRRSPVLNGLVRERKLAIVGGVFDLATGRVTLVDDGRA